MADTPSTPDDVSPDEAEIPKSRSPVERAIVWTLIAGLCVVLGIEYLSQRGYNSTRVALEELLENPEAMVAMSKVRTLISGSPSETQAKGKKRGTEVIELRWFSLFKHYQVDLTIEADEADPLLIGLATPGAPAVTPVAAGPAATPEGEGMDPMAMGMMPMTPGGPGGAGGPGGPGGGGGGFTRRSPGMLGDLEQEWVQAELGMTDEQLAKLPEIAESVRPDFSSFRDMSNEQRQAARQEMESKSEAAAKGLLDEEQFGRVRELMFQRLGAAAIARDDVATELGLDDSQKKQVAELAGQMRDALRELGFRATHEQREEAAAPWNGLLLEVLNEEQAGKWQAMLGAPPENVPEPEPPQRPQRPAAAE